MNNQQITSNNKRSTVLTLIGMAVMILLTATKVMPSSKVAGYSVLIGIVLFFITEAVSKTKGVQSGLRFNTILSDIKKTGVILWMFLPIVSGILTLILGNLIFGGEYVDHVVGRVDSIVSFDKITLLMAQFIILPFGEEIAYRGFFLGKGSKIFPVWICAAVSSIVFAAGHFAIGNIGIVTYDIFSVFIDSLIFSVIYQKSGNCVISTISHILGNLIFIVAVFVFFK